MYLVCVGISHVKKTISPQQEFLSLMFYFTLAPPSTGLDGHYSPIPITWIRGSASVFKAMQQSRLSPLSSSICDFAHWFLQWNGEIKHACTAQVSSSTQTAPPLNPFIWTLCDRMSLCSLHYLGQRVSGLFTLCWQLSVIAMAKLSGLRG